MLHVTPFAHDPPEEAISRWPALLISAGLHLGVILFVLLRTPALAENPAAPVEFPEDRQQIAIEPMPQFDPQQNPPAPEPTPSIPDEPVALGPDSDRPDERIPREQGQTEPPPPDAPIATTPPRTNQQEPAEEPAPGQGSGETAERIARAEETGQTGRLQTPTSPWGPSRTILNPGPAGGAASAPATASAGAMGRAGVSKVDGRAWQQSFPEAAGRCVEMPDFGTNPDGSPVLASVLGIVKDDKGFPLPNAHLQLVGHTYSTFTDRQGRYRLEFNPKLLERCRVQYIRVSADGYSGANLVLAIGRQVVSDDVVLRRR